jgi:hypothetical protein
MLKAILAVCAAVPQEFTPLEKLSADPNEAGPKLAWGIALGGLPLRGFRLQYQYRHVQESLVVLANAGVQFGENPNEPLFAFGENVPFPVIQETLPHQPDGDAAGGVCVKHHHVKARHVDA